MLEEKAIFLYARKETLVALHNKLKAMPVLAFFTPNLLAALRQDLFLQLLEDSGRVHIYKTESQLAFSIDDPYTNNEVTEAVRWCVVIQVVRPESRVVVLKDPEF